MKDSRGKELKVLTKSVNDSSIKGSKHQSIKDFDAMILCCSDTV